MATQVIKRDGTNQPYDEEKMKGSIEGACQDAGLSDEETVKVVGEVFPVAQSTAAGVAEITTSELKAVILAELDRLEPRASAAWRKHDEEKGAMQI